MDDQRDHREEHELRFERNHTDEDAGGHIEVPAHQLDGQQRDHEQQRIVLSEAEVGIRDLVEQQRPDCGGHQPDRQPGTSAPEERGADSDRRKQDDLPDVDGDRKPQCREGRGQERQHWRFVEVPDDSRGRLGNHRSRNQVQPGQLHRFGVDAAQPRRLRLVRRRDAGVVGDLRKHDRAADCRDRDRHRPGAARDCGDDPGSRARSGGVRLTGRPKAGERHLREHPNPRRAQPPGTLPTRYRSEHRRAAGSSGSRPPRGDLIAATRRTRSPRRSPAPARTASSATPMTSAGASITRSSEYA